MTAPEIISTLHGLPVHVQYSRLLNRIAQIQRKTTRCIEMDFNLFNEMEPVEEKLIRMATWLAKTEGS